LISSHIKYTSLSPNEDILFGRKSNLSLFFHTHCSCRWKS